MYCPYLNKKGEDKRLLNWKKWIEIRKRLHRKMYEIQHRRPSELVLNASNNYRLIKEVQTLHEYAKIPEVVSNRGKPSFFNLPPASKKHSSLISVMPKPLDYEIPEIITAGIPISIQREKETLTSKNPKDSLWFKNEYLKIKNKDLESDIKRIASHTAMTKHLIIKGKKMNINKRTDYNSETELDENVDMPYISIANMEDKSVTELDEDSICNKTIINNDITVEKEDIIPISSLQIEGAKFTAKGSQEIKKHYVFIEYEIGKNDIIHKTVHFKNIGNVAIRYYWYRHLPKRVALDILPVRLPKYGFIFRKNESIILPQHDYELNISFKTNSPGVYKEIWEMRTEPNVFDGKIIKGEFYLVLYACAEIANFAESENAILNRIDEGMKYTIVEEALVTILERSKSEKLIDYGKIVTEKDLFEAINAKFGPPGTLPLIYHYNEQITKKLKALYDTLKTEDDPPTWNYKLDDIENLINTYENKSEKYYYKFTFNHLVENIFKTNMIENDEREKYQTIYDLLCIMIDLMSEKVYNLQEKYHIYIPETYPAFTEKEILKEEKLDINCRSRLYFPDVTQQAALKRLIVCKDQETENLDLLALRTVPFEDIEQRYRIYQKEKYGIDVDLVADPKKKAKGKEKDNSKKSTAKDKGRDKAKDKEKDKGKGKDKKSSMQRDSITQENSLTKLYTSKLEICPEFSYSEHDFNTFAIYYYNLYFSIYFLLCETVNEIECLLDHMNATKKISRQVLRRCIEFGMPTMPSPSELQEFKRNCQAMFFDDIKNLSSISDYTSSVSSIESITKSYSQYDYNFLQPVSSLFDIEPSDVEMVNAQTETDTDELFPPKTRIGNVQTDECNEEFDLVALVEKELSATSIQHFIKPKCDKSTQVEIFRESI